MNIIPRWRWCIFLNIISECSEESGEVVSYRSLSVVEMTIVLFQATAKNPEAPPLAPL
ncbi:MAG: hypothetical protein GX121_07840 [Ignavibacteria bacterium]|nr:hypothetical protein [Ignavibacteria bacterium]